MYVRIVHYGGQVGKFLAQYLVWGLKYCFDA
jgi:hypothetical protein